MACIYLIQPKEYIGTGTCKIGMSRKNDLQRPKSYGIGTRFLCIMECQNPFRLEKKIIEKFNDSFQKIQGNEYFCHCGEEDEMIKLFIEIVLQHKIVDRKEEEVKDYLTDSDSEDIKPLGYYHQPRNRTDIIDELAWNLLLERRKKAKQDQELINTIK